nr:hypothetical protein [Candidatus Baldrarchaeota archaeon]
MKPKVFIAGHSHIDAAWLWRKNETIEIYKNTFNTVLNLMKSCPELKFKIATIKFQL